MYRIYKFLAFSLMLSLALPAGVFASNVYVGSPVSNSFSQVKPLVAISVHQAKASAVIVPLVTSGASLSVSCSVFASSFSNVVQNASAINLNQPASCFTLVPGSVTVQPSLIVTPLRALPSIVIKPVQRVAQYPAYGHVPASADTALPLLVAGALVGFLYEEKVRIQKLGRKLGALHYVISLEQMQILRC